MLIKRGKELSPDWVTGFIDAEGCFIIGVRKCNVGCKAKERWVVVPCFEIELHAKDLGLLYLIKSFFKESGDIYLRKSKKSAVYQIRDLGSLMDTVIPHFSKYPLISQKQKEYKVFHLILVTLLNNKYFTRKGIMKIEWLKSLLYNNDALPSEDIPKSEVDYMRYNLGDTLLKVDYELRNVTCDWFSGFMSGDGCFFVNIYKVKDCNTGYAVKLSISVTKHLKDKVLMENIAKVLMCGRVYKHSKNTLVLKISTFKHLFDIVIPLLMQYPIRGVKSKDFKDFCKIASKVKDKAHLNPLGLEEIRKIKWGMNSRRSLEE